MTKLTKEEKFLSPEQRALIEMVKKEEEYERKAREGEYSLLKTMNVYFFGHPQPPIGVPLFFYGIPIAILLVVLTTISITI